MPIFYSLLGIEIILLIYFLNKWNITPVPTIFLFYILSGQIVFCLVHDGILINRFLFLYTRNGLHEYFLRTEVFYFCLFVFISLCHIKLPGIHSESKQVEKTIINTNNLQSNRWNAIGFISISIIYVIYCISIKWDIAWRNGTYILMETPEVMKYGFEKLQILNSLLLPLGLIAASQSALNVSCGSIVNGLLFAVLAMFPSVYLLAGHSRSASGPPIAFIAVLLLSSKKRHSLLSTLTLSYAVLAFLGGLAGRDASVHGFSTIPDIFSNISNLIRNDQGGIFINLFEGFFVVAEGFTLSPSYPLSYKILSISPTPSLIDHFDAIRDVYQIRLHDYVPMSGFSEALSFGAYYLFISCLIMAFSFRLVFYVFRISKITFYIANFLLFFGLYTLNAYNLRNGFRLIWLADAVALAFLVWSRISNQKALRSGIGVLGDQVVVGRSRPQRARLIFGRSGSRRPVLTFSADAAFRPRRWSVAKIGHKPAARTRRFGSLGVGALLHGAQNPPGDDVGNPASPVYQAVDEVGSGCFAAAVTARGRLLRSAGRRSGRRT